MAEYGISTQHGCKIDQKLMIILGFHGSVCLDMYIYICTVLIEVRSLRVDVKNVSM